MQTLIQWISGALSQGVKQPGLLTTHLQLVPSQEYVDPHIYSSILLHGDVLN
jgi:hypothetical protein